MNEIPKGLRNLRVTRRDGGVCRMVCTAAEPNVQGAKTFKPSLGTIVRSIRASAGADDIRRRRRAAQQLRAKSIALHVDAVYADDMSMLYAVYINTV